MNFEGQSTNKEYYRFNEVTSITGVKPYVLRFWETEFDQIRPSLLENGQKAYLQGDINLINKIKSLLFEDKLSIPEAKLELTKILADEAKVEETISNDISTSIEANDEIASVNNNVAYQTSSLEMMKKALEVDLAEKKSVVYKKQFNFRYVFC